MDYSDECVITDRNQYLSRCYTPQSELCEPSKCDSDIEWWFDRGMAEI